ncbi:MAG: YdcF family protein [Gemmatimonadales bacterium]
MDTSPAVSERQRHNADASIYEARNPAASEVARDGRVYRAITGFVLGVTIWLLLSRFGVPHIFGLPSAGGELPFGGVGAAIGLTRFRKWLVWTAALLIALLLVVSLTNVVERPARSFIRVDRVPRAADAVVVLSAGVTSDGFMPQQGSDRLRKGLELIKSGIAPNLVVSRERRFIGKDQISSVNDQDKLIAMAGVPTFLATGWARSTHDEALFVAKLARERGWKRIVLVTSPFHSRRACATFEWAGVLVSCIPADSRDIAVRALKDPDDRIAAFSMLLYETAGTIKYHLQGWL